MNSEVASGMQRTLAHRRHAGLSAPDICGRLLGLAYFSTYVASNASTDYEPSTSPAKHILMLLLAMFSLATVPGTALFSLLVFLPIVALYALGNLYTYALMAAVFALALPLVSRVLQQVVNERRRGDALILLLVALIPALSALLQGELDAIWSFQYSRGRLLMGYWHPKEAAACFALPLLLYILMQGKARMQSLLLLAPLGLWMIGSRNVSLAVYLFLGLWRFPKATVILLAVLTAAGMLFFITAGDAFDLLNELSSLRLGVWSDALSDPSGAAGDDLLVGSRLAIDSFYIELAASTGLAGLLVFLAWASALYKLLGSRRHWRAASRPLLVSVLFFAAFDSGLVSTGNVLHVTLWALATMGLFSLRPARLRSSKSARAPVPALTSAERT